MKTFFLKTFLVFILLGVFAFPGEAMAQVRRSSSSPSPFASPEAIPTTAPTPKPDLTQKSEETLGPLESLLESQKLAKVWPFNPIKFAIRGAVNAGVPTNTIVLLLLLPGIAALITAARHLIGLRGFGIFLPAALAVTFVATGPVLGIVLFLVIVTISTLARILLRKSKIKLQYLPRMALILWFVVASVLGVLFAAPLIKYSSLANVSIFAVLILSLLAEDFTRVQIGKSINTAINLTTETLILALVSYLFLTFEFMQRFVLTNPEIYLLSILIFDFILGKYSGLRILEIIRFRKMLTS